MRQVRFTQKAKQFGKIFGLALALIMVMTITTLVVYSKGVGMLVAIGSAFGILLASFMIVLIGALLLGYLVCAIIKRWKDNKAEEAAFEQLMRLVAERAEERMAEEDAIAKRKAPAKRKASPTKKTGTKKTSPKKKSSK